ncbi:MAG: iron-containing redox enzyme family protein [Deltaproteobacteria bacterium]|nr:iron-containing redox enzyme family protein [Deltaproteobacteria bacterium]
MKPEKDAKKTRAEIREKNAEGPPSAVLAVVDEVRKKIAFDDNPYFKALTDGTFVREDFVETQKQFFHAVTAFGRPMAVLSSRIDDLQLRTELMRNVWEEHGEGNAALSHRRTFQRFLSRLETNDDETRQAGPEVRAFNLAISGACSAEKLQTGLSVMGMVEYIFAEVSSWIGRAIVEKGWLKAEDVVHYDLHEKLDVRHAEDFFRALEPYMVNLDDVTPLRNDLLLGAHLFDELYRGLFAARAKREDSPGKKT